MLVDTLAPSAGLARLRRFAAGPDPVPPALVRAAGRCGVTRLADVTLLDQIGIPVFQAVRPLSRALCVHQGKGLALRDAMIGALMEAVESHQAEHFDRVALTAPWNALPARERAPDPADFAADRARPPAPDAPLAWAEAIRLDGQGRLFVPERCVSLDHRREGDPRLDRTSNGMGAGFSRESALVKGLLEVIERDAHQAWMARSRPRRSLDRIEPDTIPYRWWRALQERLEAARLRAGVHLIDTPFRLPVVVAELLQIDADDWAGGAVYGVACHLDAETALRGAVLEAVQTRLTFISGARDDIDLPDPQRRSTLASGFGFPLPPGLRPGDWTARSAPLDAGALPLSDLVARLDLAGYPGAAAVDLSPSGGEVFVAKVFAPGLGAFGRVRRAPRS